MTRRAPRSAALRCRAASSGEVVARHLGHVRGASSTRRRADSRGRRRWPAACRAPTSAPWRIGATDDGGREPATGGDDRLPPQDPGLRADRPRPGHPAADAGRNLAHGRAAPRPDRNRRARPRPRRHRGCGRGRPRAGSGRSRPRPRSRRSWARRPVLRTSTSSRSPAATTRRRTTTGPAPSATSGAVPPGCSAGWARPTNVADAGPSTWWSTGSTGAPFTVRTRRDSNLRSATNRPSAPPAPRSTTSPEGSEMQKEPASTSVTRVPGGETRMPIGGDHSRLSHTCPQGFAGRRRHPARGISPTA